MKPLSQPQRSSSWHTPLLACGLALCVFLASCAKLDRTGAPDPNSPEFQEQVLQIIRDNPEVIIESVQTYQEEQQQALEQKQQEFVKQLVSDPKAAIGDSPVTGAKDSDILLVEFSDFQCPFCARAHETVKQFMDKHGDRVTLTYKHLPLSQIHPEALPAAKAAWAAQQQGKFWEYYSALFTQQAQLGDELYVKIANDLNLDIEQFNRDRASAEATAAIEKDLKLARELNLNGTPFFFMNDRGLRGAVELSDLETALAEIEAEKAGN